MQQGQIHLWVVCPRFVEPLLHDELINLGCTDCRQGLGGVFATTTWDNVYRLCLHLRLASRVIWVLARGDVTDQQAMYQIASSVPWPSMFTVDRRVHFRAKGTNRWVRKTSYAALVLKDAVMDAFATAYDKRPPWVTDDTQAEVLVTALIKKQQLIVGIDISGGG